MSNPNDFIIENGVLKKYKGPGGDVVIPDGVTSIGYKAFSHCKNLISITIPDSVTSICHYAFEYCTGLTSITIPDSVTSIDAHVFLDCANLTSAGPIGGRDSIEFGWKTSIPAYAFYNCRSLMSVTIPDSVTSIAGLAFYDCTGLTTVTIPDSVTSIGGAAFKGCTSLAGSNGFVIVRNILFDYKGPGGSVTIPDSVTSIGNWAFEDCCSLTSVTIPDSVTSIGDYAFHGCSGLTSVTIPDSVTSIGGGAFYNCSSLTSVTIPDSVTSISDSVFNGCTGLADSNGFVIVRNILFDYKRPGGNVTIPDNVTNIGSGAFFGCKKLKTVTIPDSVTSIGKQAFENCTGLTTVTIPDSVTSIGDMAFKGCKGLMTVTIPDSATSIGNEAFKNCRNLSSVVLPEGRDVEWLLGLDPKGQLCEFFPDLNDFCKAASEARMTELITRANKWPSKWKKLFFASYLYSDTRAAMLLADKRGELSQYAAMRGLDEDVLRDGMLSDLGLNKDRCKVYSLGNLTVTVRLLAGLSLALELPDGTPLKTLPKKGADPEKYNAAKADFAQMKKDVVKIWKNRADVLLRDFLSGRELTAEYWTGLYGGNPIFHAVACLLVWEQDGQTFLRTDTGTVLSDGTPYTLTDGPIRLAHPMEMKTKEVTAWQHYFTSHLLKQPFEQIWEPVEQADLVKSGRYDGCTIPLYYLMNKEKHGIIMEGQKRLKLRGCSADLIYIEGHRDWVNNEFEVKNFRFKKYTRQVNHIVVHLDKGTVAGRIKKDDITVARWFDRFTLAQITEFIKLAQENNAVNVLALLLDYKNAHFADFDPMDEFTLEW